MVAIRLIPFLIFGAARSLGADAAELGQVDYNRDVRPILSNACFKCHGPDVTGNPSGLRLDIPEFALAPHRSKTGRVTTALVPGKPDASEVWRRLISKDATTVMPPPDALHQVNERERAVIRRWIEQGAHYQPHWAYAVPLKRVMPTLPDGRSPHPIDFFVQAELKAKGLAAAPLADRRTLIRRLSLDLTGLPPTPVETATFMVDQRPAAYADLVDRYLASPHYGERMAVPWLDLVRFADSTGLHGDQLYNNFPYRDYVIGAFNRNKPFDQFTMEQIAGDLLPNTSIEHQVASGFNRLNMVTREGGAQVGEYLAKYASDRVRTVSTVWLGSTLACAECHDHKYDPFTIRDFYAFSAYFADVKQWGVYRHFIYTPEPELTVHTDHYPFPPEIEVSSDFLRNRDARLRATFAESLATGGRTLVADPDGVAAVQTWAKQAATWIHSPRSDTWIAASVDQATSTNGVVTSPLADGSVRFANPPSYLEDKYKNPPTRHQLSFQTPEIPLASVRIEILPDDAHGGFVTRDRRDLFDLAIDFAIQRDGEAKPQALAVAESFAECETENYFNGRRVMSLRNGWRSSVRLAREPQSAVFQLPIPVTLAPGDRLVATITSNPVNFHQRAALGEVGRIRLSVSPLAISLPGEPADSVRFPAGALTPADAGFEQTVLAYFRANAAFSDPELVQVVRDILDCRQGMTSTMVTVAQEPRITRVLPRGNWQDESGDVVEPSPPKFLGGISTAGNQGRGTRLDLARWIVSPTNPLTARTFVNRLWKQFFGTGLSSAVEDLGLQGEYPSHPELLDWLAVEFMESGWNVKSLVRLIVTSKTYQQSARERPELRTLDPQNRLLARQNARRLEAEFIRDHALFTSGLLRPELGGPSAFPYQPEGYYAQLNFPLRDYVADHDDRQYRRGLYTHRQRTFLHPMLANFDAPSREECTPARNLSNTPQQALTLLNDPSFVEAARALAEQLLAYPLTERLDQAFERVLTRPPTEAERASLEKFHAAQLTLFRERPDDAQKFTAIGLLPTKTGHDAVELAAWTAVTRALFNLNETITRY
jgi:hypothetical protein